MDEILDTVADLTSDLRALFYFEKQAYQCKGIASSLVTEMGNVSSALSQGYKVPGIEYYGSNNITGMSSKLGIVNRNLNEITMQIPADKAEKKSELRRQLEYLRQAVDNKNRTHELEEEPHKKVDYASLPEVIEANKWLNMIML